MCFILEQNWILILIFFSWLKKAKKKTPKNNQKQLNHANKSDISSFCATVCNRNTVRKAWLMHYKPKLLYFTSIPHTRSYCCKNLTNQTWMHALLKIIPNKSHVYSGLLSAVLVSHCLFFFLQELKMYSWPKIRVPEKGPQLLQHEGQWAHLYFSSRINVSKKHNCVLSLWILTDSVRVACLRHKLVLQPSSRPNLCRRVCFLFTWQVTGWLTPPSHSRWPSISSLTSPRPFLHIQSRHGAHQGPIRRGTECDPHHQAADARQGTSTQIILTAFLWFCFQLSKCPCDADASNNVSLCSCRRWEAS